MTIQTECLLCFQNTTTHVLFVVGPPTSLSFTKQPSNTVAGQLVPPIRVRAQDDVGNPTSSISVTLDKGNCTSLGEGVITAKLTDVNGIVEFTTVSLSMIDVWQCWIVRGRVLCVCVCVCVCVGFSIL
jgi:hypothetical protein